MANIGEGTIAVIQGTNQYLTGLFGGYIVDLIATHIPIEHDNVYHRFARQLIQVGLNGIALSFMIKFVHGSEPMKTYRDYTGGYMLALGLIQSQPTFMKNGKDLANGLHLFIRDITMMKDAPRNDQEILLKAN
jgi:hypothetical protein